MHARPVPSPQLAELRGGTGVIVLIPQGNKLSLLLRCLVPRKNHGSILWGGVRCNNEGTSVW